MTRDEIITANPMVDFVHVTAATNLGQRVRTLSPAVVPLHNTGASIAP